MRNTMGLQRGLLLLTLSFSMLGVSAGFAANDKYRSFDIPAQPLSSALNEFAKQADIALMFSYDLVAGESTRALKGTLSVEEGFTWLLGGTSLEYRRTAATTYLICAKAACERDSKDAH